MTQQTINVGAAPDDDTGDPLRTAFSKANDNFTELYGAVATLDGEVAALDASVTALEAGAFDPASPGAIGGTTPAAGTFTSLAGTGLTLTGGTVTTSAPIINGTQTWNAVGQVFTGLKVNITNSASAAGSLLFDFQVGGTSAVNYKIANGELKFGTSGGASILRGTGTYIQMNAANTDGYVSHIFSSNGLFRTVSGGVWSWSSSATDAYGFAADTGISRAAANSILFGTGASGTTTSRTEINKAITGVADNTATAVFTVTIPNGAHSASIRVRFTGSLGAGGAIGANESTQDAEYMINIARRAGVNAVATIGAVVGQAAAASVAGADNAATSATLSAISGAVGATNTFTINLTVARSGGSSTNHTGVCFAELLNANASGVTIA